nr:protein NEDD1-like [Biomphalaria glabrata]
MAYNLYPIAIFKLDLILRLTAMINLASLGDEAKIWDIPTFSLLEQFNSHDGPISDLTWSHDGNVVATCCTTDKKVQIRSTKASYSVVTDNFTLPAGSLCLDFNSTSRFLLCGCDDGSFHIWDRKTQTIKKSSSNQKNSITATRWNWNDSYLALGLETGKIILYNVVTSQANSPMNASSSQAIRQMKYNPYRKSSLVAVSDEGVVSFWDTNARRLLHSFTNTHQAPAKDLAFSPINDYLMVSVGLDKRAVFYDVQNKSSVKTILADQPLTSVDMMPDGATVVVGTSRGNIFVYDMRQSATPVFTLAAHKSSVKRLSFVKREDIKNDASNQRRQLPSTPLLSSTEETHQISGNVQQSLGLDIFSPMREDNKSNNSTAERSGHAKSWLYNRSGVGENLEAVDAGLGIFSPLRNDNSQSVTSIHGTSSFLGNNSFLNQLLSPTVKPTAGDRSQVVTNNMHSSVNGFTDSTHIPVSDVLSSNLSSEDQNTNGISNKTDNATSSVHIDTSAPLITSFQNAHTSSPLQNYDSYQKMRSPPRDKFTPHRPNRTPTENRIRLDDLPSTPANGSTASISPRDIRFSSEERKMPGVSSNKSDVAAPSGSSSLTPQSTSSLRHLVQDLLSEQFQEHHKHLKSEIRAMLGQTRETDQPRSVGSTQADSPEMYHAEFIRNLIREEMDDLKDYIHKEFWSVQVEVIKQAFQLQRQMQAGFAECLINPILLDEIDRLKEENARLRKTF